MPPLTGKEGGRGGLTVTLRLPPRELSPNYTVGSRGGRMGKSAKTKDYREASHWAAVCAATDGPYRWPAASVQARFFFRDRRRRDRDNLLASLKAAFDGLADAGVVQDDAGLTHLPVIVDVDKANPRVELHITPGATP